jgi:LPS-assembly lipoprotein
MKMPMRATLPIALMLSLLLAACGFHLRGQSAFALPFQKLYVKSANEYAPFIIELKNALQTNSVQITDTPNQAQLTLQIVSEVADKQILSLSGAGQVLQYTLQYRISLRAYDQKQQEWIAPQEIKLRRDYSYDNSKVLAMMQEEAQLYQNMRSDAVQQVLRRLNHAHPPLPDTPQ